MSEGPPISYEAWAKAVEEMNRLKAENQWLRREMEEAQLRSIEARNPGIDMDEVRRTRRARSVS